MKIYNKLVEVKALFERDEEAKRLGICEALGDDFYNNPVLVSFKRACFKSWPKYSGELGYPINYESVPVRAFCQFGEVEEGSEYEWVDGYLQLRMELLDHMIKCAQEAGV